MTFRAGACSMLLGLTALIASAAGCGARSDLRPSSFPPFDATLQSCERGDGESCAWVATMYRNAVQVAGDRARAAAFAERSCQLDFAVGCNDIGIAYLDGWGIDRNLDKAGALLGDACAKGAAVACLNLAASMPEKVPTSLSQRAFEILEADCAADRSAPTFAWRPTLAEGRDVLSCEAAARMKLEGRGVAPDRGRARALFSAGCRRRGSLCDLAKGEDGEDCAYGCRGDASHSSSCIQSVCTPDPEVGEACRASAPCSRGTYCNEQRVCAALKPRGAPCQSLVECVTRYCTRVCADPPIYLQ